jgi:bifunctional NMN adenylyltransferase/nudix hydrolase
MKTVAVLYTPFQTPVIPGPHKNVLDLLFEKYGTVVVALHQKRVTPTKNNPLGFAAREAMVREYVQSLGRYAYIVPVVDKKYPKDQVAALEACITPLFTEPIKVWLFTNEEFLSLYVENGGTWQYSTHRHGLLSAEMDARKSAMVLNCTSEDFRRGVIYAMNSQFPISWGTVDMAIRRVVIIDREAPPHEKVLYLFGKKPGEVGWRFPGGFKDVGDIDYETAVWREGGEEVLKSGIDPKSVLTKPVYISSRKVNDWRYRQEKDAITTLFYQMEFIGTEDQIAANDDLADAKWFDLSELKREDIEGEHKYLYDELVAFENRQSNDRKMYCQNCKTVLTCDCGICPSNQLAK